MAPIPVVAPTIVRVTLQHNLGNGRHADVVWDYSVDEGTGSDRSTVAGIAANELGKAWQNNVCHLFSSAISYTGGVYMDLDSLDATGGIFGPNTSLPVNGGGTAEPIAPPNVAMLIRKVCAHTRSQRNGRSFIPAVVEGAIDNAGQIDSGQRAGWLTAMNNFINAVNGTGDPVTGADTALRVVHVTGHAASEGPGIPPKPNAWSSSDIISFNIDAKVASQRRRNRG